MGKTTFKSIIDSEKPVLIDFYADWCAPCKAMAPFLESLKQEMGDKATILKINVDNNPQLSQNLQIQSIPTVMIFQKGELKWRAMGVQSKNAMKSQLEALI